MTETTPLHSMERKQLRTELTLVVTVTSAGEFHDDVTDAITALDTGESADTTPTLSFTSYDDLLSTLTPRVLELVETIRREEPAMSTRSWVDWPSWGSSSSRRKASASGLWSGLMNWWSRCRLIRSLATRQPRLRERLRAGFCLPTGSLILGNRSIRNVVLDVVDPRRQPLVGCHSVVDVLWSVPPTPRFTSVCREICRRPVVLWEYAMDGTPPPHISRVFPTNTPLGPIESSHCRPYTLIWTTAFFLPPHFTSVSLRLFYKATLVKCGVREVLNRLTLMKLMKLMNQWF